MARSSSQFSSWEESEHAWPELTAIVEQVRELTNASGAAIALTTNRPAEVDCCARSGSTAPALGKSTLPEDSLTALCIRNGKQVQCDNAETDPGLQGTAVFDLGVRSLVVTPICQEDGIRGVLAVFANTAHAFSAAHLAELNGTAERLAGVLAKDGRVSEKPPARLLALLTTTAMPVRDAGSKPIAQIPPLRQARQPLENPLPLPEMPAHDFATFAAVAIPQKKWLTANVLLMAAAGFVIVAGLAMCGYLASRSGAKKAGQAQIARVETQPPTEVESKAQSEAQPNADPAPPADAESAATSVETPGAQPALRLEPVNLAPRQGDTVTVNLVFSHGRDISSVPMQINYDPVALRFVSISNGGFLSSGGKTVILIHREDPSTGTIKINAQLPPGDGGVSGDGIVCRLAFVAVEKGHSAISVVASPRDSHAAVVTMPASRVALTVN